METWGKKIKKPLKENMPTKPGKRKRKIWTKEKKRLKDELPEHKTESRTGKKANRNKKGIKQ